MQTITPTQLLYSVLLAGSIASISGIFRLLTFSGALAAFAVGFFIFAFGGLTFAVPLIAFFVSSSLLSRIGRKRKAALNAGYEKTANRDAGQVLANGFVPAALAISFTFTQHPRQTMFLYLASLAAVNADTWATEIGGLMPGQPWLVSTMRKVAPGTSGAVSVVGLIAALAGALFIAMSGWLVWPPKSIEFMFRPDSPEIIAITWAGFVASYADSLIGATLQAQYRCGKCGEFTERSEHCGQVCKRSRGFAWVTNDIVNLIASASGALFCWLLLKYFAYPI